MDVDHVEPEKVKTIDNVTSFELTTKNNKTKLFYCKDSAIYKTDLKHGEEIEDGEESTRELERLEKALYTNHVNEKQLIFADRSENVYLLSKLEGDELEAKLLLEKKPGV